jgi:hypothetical protein
MVSPYIFDVTSSSGVCAFTSKHLPTLFTEILHELQLTTPDCETAEILNRAIGAIGRTGSLTNSEIRNGLDRFKSSFAASPCIYSPCEFQVKDLPALFPQILSEIHLAPSECGFSEILLKVKNRTGGLTTQQIRNAWSHFQKKSKPPPPLRVVDPANICPVKDLPKIFTDMLASEKLDIACEFPQVLLKTKNMTGTLTVDQIKDGWLRFQRKSKPPPPFRAVDPANICLVKDLPKIFTDMLASGKLDIADEFPQILLKTKNMTGTLIVDQIRSGWLRFQKKSKPPPPLRVVDPANICLVKDLPKIFTDMLASEKLDIACEFPQVLLKTKNMTGTLTVVQIRNAWFRFQKNSKPSPLLTVGMLGSFSHCSSPQHR